ncbi:MAG TPA: L-histidine N(alpha)-methyltransferase [Rhizomicrobium sp.]|nr:L-histidine N(alpha)-methyltransferase [Rhizomicrobium sp.]
MSSAAIAYRDVLQLERLPRGEFADALVSGLRKSPKELPCKFFYDETGSALFDRICELPEYYPTRTEIGLLKRHAAEFAALMGKSVDLVEFGAGSLQKVGYLLDALDTPHSYVPIDISGDYLNTMAARLRSAKPDLAVHPIVADFTKPLRLSVSGARRIGFFPGSTIGNFTHMDAFGFLERAARLLRGGGLLIGVDLIKDPAILHAAYNDTAGVTALFNKNILVRANREIGAGFNLDSFAHYAPYNPIEQRIEMHLISLKKQTVDLSGVPVSFAEGETIHTENSHKYSVDGFRALASSAGFIPKAVWLDDEELFSLHWLEAPA